MVLDSSKKLTASLYLLVLIYMLLAVGKNSLGMLNFKAFAGASAGQRLMGISYGEHYGRLRCLIHYILAVIAPYLGGVAASWLRTDQDRGQGGRILTKLTGLIKVINGSVI